MRYAIFSDVQGNYEALGKFFNEVGGTVDRYLCLGDIVQKGVSFDDNLCVNLVRKNECLTVRGNHEDRVLAKVEVSRKKILPQNLEYLSSLPVERIVDGRYQLIHAPSDQRIVSVEQAAHAFPKLSSVIDICFFGHSHQSTLFSKNKSGQVKKERFDFSPQFLRDSCQYMINPGGVGLYNGLPQTYIIFDDISRKLELRKNN